MNEQHEHDATPGSAPDASDTDAALLAELETLRNELDQLRATGKDLITSRQLAENGKPTLDLGVVSTEFAEAHPEVVDIWRQQQARALDLIKDAPDAVAQAISAEIGSASTPVRSTGISGGA